MLLVGDTMDSDGGDGDGDARGVFSSPSLPSCIASWLISCFTVALCDDDDNDGNDGVHGRWSGVGLAPTAIDAMGFVTVTSPTNGFVASHNTAGGTTVLLLFGVVGLDMDGVRLIPTPASEPAITTAAGDDEDGVVGVGEPLALVEVDR